LIWFDDVRVFQVNDLNQQTDLIGYFFLDLHPRDGKYSHFACFNLQPRFKLADGVNQQYPAAAMLANFTRPTPDQPALLEHDEVETFFHEFGHVMHQLCSINTKYANFSGTRVERDFVEAPSQMLENWVWEKESLSLMTGEPIPDDLLEKLVKSRIANAGLLNKRQILLATFDQTIHTSPHCDTFAVLKDLQQKIMHIEITPGTNMAGSFGHLAGGYPAQYYGYLWSEVYSADMFFFKFKIMGILNPQVGKEYRDKILAWGGSRDAFDMLRDFLGREPNNEAFLRMKGISSV